MTQWRWWNHTTMCRLHTNAEETTILQCSLYKKYALQTGWRIHFMPSTGADSFRSSVDREVRTITMAISTFKRIGLSLLIGKLCRQWVCLCDDRKWGSTWLPVKAFDSKCGLVQLTWILLTDATHFQCSFKEEKQALDLVVLFWDSSQSWLSRLTGRESPKECF